MQNLNTVNNLFLIVPKIFKETERQTYSDRSFLIHSLHIILNLLYKKQVNMEEIEFPLTVDNLNSNLKLGRIRQQKGFLLNNTFYL